MVKDGEDKDGLETTNFCLFNTQNCEEASSIVKNVSDFGPRHEKGPISKFPKAFTFSSAVAEEGQDWSEWGRLSVKLKLKLKLKKE